MAIAILKSNLDDLKSRKFYVALVAEFLGTLLLVLVGCGSVENPESKRSLLHISLCFGLSVASIVWAIANVSGGHINPAVTIGFLVTRRISLVRALLYMVVQTVGAIVGAGLLKALTPQNSSQDPLVINNSLGTVGLGGKVTVWQGFGVEFLISFVFIFVIFSAVDSQRGDIGGSIPLTIGLTIAMCHLWAIPFTGSGMNPARSFGPALITRKWADHWIYWAGPLLGGAVGGILYDFVFAANAGLAKLMGFFTSDYDNDDYTKNGRRQDRDDGTEMKP